MSLTNLHRLFKQKKTNIIDLLNELQLRLFYLLTDTKIIIFRWKLIKQTDFTLSLWKINQTEPSVERGF